MFLVHWNVKVGNATHHPAACEAGRWHSLTVAAVSTRRTQNVTPCGRTGVLAGAF